MKDTSNADITIKATGMQWKWGYDYLKGEGEGISFLSNLSTPRTQVGAPGVVPTEARGENYLMEVDNEVVVPVNKKIRIVTTANDVIHAWMIPAFGVKQDAIPGFVRDTWFKSEHTGTFRGNCAELCGKEHAFMPIVVKVVTAAEYSAWVQGKQKEMAALADDPNKTWTIDELKTKGEKVYTANCAVCHQASGKGVPGAFAHWTVPQSSTVRAPTRSTSAERPEERQVPKRNAGLETAVRHRYRCRDHLHPQQLVEQASRKHRSTSRSCGCP
jgi:cytochrome c oxidase subunit 2